MVKSEEEKILKLIAVTKFVKVQNVTKKIIVQLEIYRTFYIHTCIYIYTHTHTCIYTHTYSYSYIHACIYTQTHTYVNLMFVDPCIIV